jgi:hypothetical protein
MGMGHNDLHTACEGGGGGRTGSKADGGGRHPPTPAQAGGNGLWGATGLRAVCAYLLVSSATGSSSMIRWAVQAMSKPPPTSPSCADSMRTRSITAFEA